MSVTVELPQLGETVLEGTVARWLVKEGERVQRDQPLVEITTDKVDAEIPSPEEGVLEKILVAEGETVAVGAALARIAAGVGAGAQDAAPATEKEPAPKQTPARKTAAKEDEPEAPSAPARESAPRATPVARRLAAEEGVGLADVTATGPGGRVAKADVEKARAARAPAPSPAAAEAPKHAAAGETRAVAASLPAGGGRPRTCPIRSSPATG
ncbi:MAG: E3 binding domain-containing protein [Myxococcota bacterium]|nr:E3 binding domain-containing protein [Myxococcota bacterium]